MHDQFLRDGHSTVLAFGPSSDVAAFRAVTRGVLEMCAGDSQSGIAEDSNVSTLLDP